MAQTLKFGNGNFATKAGSTLCYDDQNGNFKPIPMDFTRASTATRVNKQGLIEVVKSNVPRIDYTDTSDGVLLLEKAATNLITYSEDFSNSYWAKGAVSIASNSITSPDGTLNSNKVIEDTTNANHYIDTSSISVTSGSSYTVSVFVRDNGRNLTIQGSSSITASAFATFDLKNGFIITESVGNATIKNFGNNWYKCSLTFTAPATTNGTVTFLMGDTRSDIYQGDGTSGFYLWGAMLEQNSVASSYIPTQGSATTRVAETASGAGNSEVFSDSQGVLFANILKSNVTDYSTLSISADANNFLNIGFNSSNKFFFRITANNSTVLNNESISSTDNRYYKIAFKYKSGDVGIWIDGIEVFQSTQSFSFTSALSDLNFKFRKSDALFPFYGKTKEIGYYDAILTDLELETLTSYRTWISMVNELNLNIIYNG
jgi:hypothetical protein